MKMTINQMVINSKYDKTWDLNWVLNMHLWKAGGVHHVTGESHYTGLKRNSTQMTTGPPISSQLTIDII
jgi:hypothetical protein